MALVLAVTLPAGVCRDTVVRWVGQVGARQTMKHSARLRAKPLHAHVDLLLLGRGHLDPEG